MTQNYLHIHELDTNLYEEIREAIARYGESPVYYHIETAMDTVRAKLSARYDLDTEFTAQGTDRNHFILNIVKDIAIYHLYSTQETIPAIRVKRFDDAMAMLKDIQAGKSSLIGLQDAILSPPDPNASNLGLSYGSNPQRHNYW